MVLYRLRCGALEKDMANQFGVSISNVSRMLNMWINFLYRTLKELPIWPASKVIKDTILSCFKDEYSKTRVFLIVLSYLLKCRHHLVLRFFSEILRHFGASF